MIPARLRIAATACVLLVLSASLHAQEIYDNTDIFLGPRSFTALQIGDEVNAAGTEREIIEILIGVSMQGFAGTADLQARLYANDGAGGQPGTLLWESVLFDDVGLTGGDDLISFEVPEITVPDTFTWTIQISDTSPVAAGLPHYDPPAIGSSPDNAWFGNGSSWTPLTSPGGPVNFMAHIVAGGSCPADLNGNGGVGPEDLATLLGQWGQKGVPADLDGGGVGPSDLAILLGAWGLCP